MQLQRQHVMDNKRNREPATRAANMWVRPRSAWGEGAPLLHPSPQSFGAKPRSKPITDNMSITILSKFLSCCLVFERRQLEPKSAAAPRREARADLRIEDITWAQSAQAHRRDAIPGHRLVDQRAWDESDLISVPGTKATPATEKQTVDHFPAGRWCVESLLSIHLAIHRELLLHSPALVVKINTFLTTVGGELWVWVGSTFRLVSSSL